MESEIEVGYRRLLGAAAVRRRKTSRRAAATALEMAARPAGDDG